MAQVMNSLQGEDALLRPEALALFLRQGAVSDPGDPLLLVRWRVDDDSEGRRVEAFAGSPGTRVTSTELLWEGVTALDLLGHLLAANELRRVQSEDTSSSPQTEPVELSRLKEQFRKWSRKISGLMPADDPLAALEVELTDPRAVLPSKERVSDSGYDLTLIDVKKQFGLVVLFGTGVKIQPPQGWYLDVVPRSSIIKRGYILANSVGIIDQSYRGEIMVPLIKIDESAPDLELPARVIQLIFRPFVHFPVALREALVKTERGEGGFGSSGT